MCINPSQLLLQLLFPKRFDIWRWTQNCAAELRFGGLHHGGGHPGCDRRAITTAVIIPKRSVNHHHLYIYIIRCFFPHDVLIIYIYIYQVASININPATQPQPLLHRMVNLRSTCATQRDCRKDLGRLCHPGGCGFVDDRPCGSLLSIWQVSSICG